MGLESWSEITDPRGIASDRLTISGDTEATQAFRRSQASRHVVLTMPGIVGRAPYSNRANPVEAFAFDESGPPLVIGAHWPLGVCLANAFRTHGWLAKIHGNANGGAVAGLAQAVFDASAEPRVAETQISDRRENELMKAGLTSLVMIKNTDQATFLSVPTLYRPADAAEQIGQAAGRALALELTHARLAHHLMCMCRDWVGGHREGPQLQAELEFWLQQYVSTEPLTDQELLAKFPLRHAGIAVEPSRDPGYYQARLDISPAFQFQGFEYDISGLLILPQGRGTLFTSA